MIGVVVPAHNESGLIGACLASIGRAANFRKLGEPVQVVVVLDACTDATEEVARRHGVVVLHTASRNVGVARKMGAEHALSLGARWLAFTDADSMVAPDWLSAQLEERSDAVCGTVEVSDWSGYPASVREQHLATYVDRDGHRHIHGANLGVAALHYRRAGGFPPLRSHEDVALVQALQAQGSRIAWSARPRVVTSARKDYRAPEGFGAALQLAATALRTPFTSMAPEPVARSA